MIAARILLERWFDEPEAAEAIAMKHKSGSVSAHDITMTAAPQCSATPKGACGTSSRWKA